MSQDVRTGLCAPVTGRMPQTVLEEAGFVTRIRAISKEKYSIAGTLALIQKGHRIEASLEHSCSHTHTHTDMTHLPTDFCTNA